MDFLIGLWSVPTADTTFTAADVNQRITALESAIKHLSDEVGKETFAPDQKICGIFIAPEYFLAHQDAEKVVSSRAIERTIDVGERDACVELIRNFSTKHKNVLIVPGTIAWKKTFARNGTDPKTTDRRIRGARHLEYYTNLDARQKLAGMQARTNAGKGYYRPSAPTRRDMILGNPTSETVGSSTFTTGGNIKYYMRNTAYAFHDGKVVYKYHKRGDFFESVNTTETVFIPSFKRPVVSLLVDSTHLMSFGFEICLDHNIEMLKRVIKDQNISDPDFHIICSASVSNDTSNMCMRSGGFMLHASSDNNETGVYKNDKGLKTAVHEYDSVIVGGSLLRLWKIAVATGAGSFLSDVKGALDAYSRSKTIFASAASKNALAKLQKLHKDGDLLGLRSHLDWYLGKPGAKQPTGAGDQIPKDKRFYTLLNAFKY